MLWLYGKHACLAALKNKNRQIHKIYHTDNIDISSFKIQKKTIIERVHIKDFDKILDRSAVHQGIALEVSPLPTYPLDFLKTENEDNQIVVILDQVEDPQNVGAILRSCAAFGAKALIMGEKNAPKETASIVKTASGSFEQVPRVHVVNINTAIKTLQDFGFWTVGFSEEAKMPLNKIPLKGKIALVMGNEGKGLRQLVSQNCDFHVNLPTQEFSTLNVATATAIALYQTHISQTAE
jgi:23S rRNA (guanosine2251-2'-O)-methyltransferase